MDDLRGRVALLTGASGGIGQAVGRLLIAAGVRTAFTYRSRAEVDAATWDRTMAVNLRAPFLLAQRALPGMAGRGFGRVLFTSSVAGFTGGIVGPHYAASKAGLHGLVHFLAARVAERGVTVNAVAPALIEGTAMLPGAARPGLVPVRRFGRPEEVADLALAVLRNGYVTSQVLSVDGGAYPR
ncbi:3-oxoacyl-[acyl-carrier-protein] reductase FabG [Nonomuraea coxensis DSM 45129]|uniref:3-oxoacyl-[acyl-carrier-protein] reductase FabG n=1 Tax=Nonomuraea coxensis DSM 45129 TaxID=1122611 RepID=A0ABX8U3H9_9ACTN|nr:SDR family NAD(P)-dependent oxidoreductase [Nonomuraea coxensis]QYC41203.1 3-oxoacyl-[acyl-carrier-protein] reductase FabG [Nonomuraea coxensis DSM 45129]